MVRSAGLVRYDAERGDIPRHDAVGIRELLVSDGTLLSGIPAGKDSTISALDGDSPISKMESSLVTLNAFTHLPGISLRAL
jgi:hypothetical protein